MSDATLRFQFSSIMAEVLQDMDCINWRKEKKLNKGLTRNGVDNEITWKYYYLLSSTDDMIWMNDFACKRKNAACKQECWRFMLYVYVRLIIYEHFIWNNYNFEWFDKLHCYNNNTNTCFIRSMRTLAKLAPALTVISTL